MLKEKEIDFYEKELCWAKLKGYPWWPAMINNKIYSKKNSLIYEVDYLGEKEKSFLSKKYIKKWKENYPKYKTCFESKGKVEKKTKTSFDCALKIGDLIYEGKINIKEHFNMLEHFQNIKKKRNKESIIKYFKDLSDAKEEANKISEFNIQNQKMNLNIDIEENNFEQNNLKIINNTKFQIPITISNSINGNGKSNIKEYISMLKNKRSRNDIPMKEPNKDINKNISELEKAKKEKGKIIEKSELQNLIGMKPSDINKIKSLVNIITTNLDSIIEKSSKYQSYLTHEFSKIKNNIKDNRQINTKIDLASYIKTMIEIFNIPISINKYIEDMKHSY